MFRKSIFTSQTTANVTKDDDSTTKEGKHTTNDASNVGGLSSTNIKIYIVGLALCVCVAFYKEEGKGGNVVVPEDIKAFAVKIWNI